MEGTRLTRSAAARAAVLGLLALVTASACARPGQLGHEQEPVPADETIVISGPLGTAGTPPTTSAPTGGTPGAVGIAPASPVAQTGSDARGRLDTPVRITTPGPAEILIRTETLAPGQTSGWITHPGTVVSVVRSGSVTVVRADACTPARIGPEQGFFVPDAAAYEMRNDGPEPAVLTRSELLAPGADERRPAEPAC